ncbi:MAG: NHL repeat-containing protein [Spirochaetales bacterium]|nr:NHL repeat-containing protein [Spirochaetales bacterium]
MKKAFTIFMLVAIALAMIGCSSVPKFDEFEPDQGVVMPYLMFGDSTDGEHDSAAYLFVAPKAIASDSMGNIYVGGKEFVLSKYSPDGEFIAVIAPRGDAEGEINYVKGIVTDSMDNVFATDSINGRINVFDADGNFVRRFGEVGEGPGNFSDVGPITMDADDNLYVSDDAQGVHVFDKNDNFIKMIGDRGDEPGQTSEFGWLAVDSDLRQLYVAVDGSGRIDVYDIDTGVKKFEMGGLGKGPGMWEEDIEGLAIGPWGLIFAIDEAGGNIKAFQSDGTFVTQWGKAGLYDGEMASAESIGYDPTNRRIVVADEKNYRVVSFSLSSLGL